MDAQEDKITPEKESALADLSSYFGIRPGTYYTGTLDIFAGMPEATRPRLTIEYMTSTAKAEYADRMAALVPNEQKKADENDEQHLLRVESSLRENRKGHAAVNEWLIKTHLVSIENYPDATKAGEFIDIKREGKELTPASWESLSFALRPHVAAFIIAKNFASELEKSAVKS